MTKLLRNPKAIHEVPRESAAVGIAAWRGRPSRMRHAHRHSDVEINFVLAGRMTYLLSGQIVSIEPGRLALFWAGAPHGLTQTQGGTEAIWVLIPLAWMLQWPLPKRFVQRLLHGELLQSPDDASATLDAVLLQQWVEDSASRDPDRRAIATLEVQARCQRLAQRLEAQPARHRAAVAGTHVERLAGYAAQHYARDIRVRDLGEAVGLHPNYAMNLFKDATGITLWDYLTRLRVSHAQRLLLCTDWKVERIARESGFHSPSSFYTAFTRAVGVTPGEYRVSTAS